MLRTKKLLAVLFGGMFFLFFGSLFASAQGTPQTARQALLEMFFSKTPGTFEKHLPQATQAALRKAEPASGASMLAGFSAITTQLSARGQQLQTFEAGPTLLLIGVIGVVCVTAVVLLPTMMPIVDAAENATLKANPTFDTTRLTVEVLGLVRQRPV